MRYGLTSALFGMGSLVVDRLPAEPIAGRVAYYHYGTALAASIPLTLVSPWVGFEVGGITLASTESEVALRHGASRDASYRPFLGLAEVFTLHQGLYAAYATYREARVRGASPAWDTAWKPWSALDLITAPFRAKNVGHPIVIVALSVGAILTGVNVGRSYGSGKRLPVDAGAQLACAVPTAFDAGVTEEAIFRGFLYEELQTSLGRWPARLIDSSLFTLAHVPGELDSQSGSQIGIGLVTRAMFSLLAEAAYDEGGLPASSALHSLWDTITLSGTAVSGVGSASAEAKAIDGPARPLVLYVPLASGAF